MRFFTTEGPVNCQDHYCLPPLARFDLEDVMALIAQKKYFLLHAPRQTGKTTCLLALADFLNRSGDYCAVYANIEGAQAHRENVDKGMTTVITDIAAWARYACPRCRCRIAGALGVGYDHPGISPGRLSVALVRTEKQTARAHAR